MAGAHVFPKEAQLIFLRLKAARKIFEDALFEKVSGPVLSFWDNRRKLICQSGRRLRAREDMFHGRNCPFEDLAFDGIAEGLAEVMHVA